MNLCGEPNKGIVDCYSLAQVVKAREYHKEKEVLKAAEEEAKLQRKIKRAANTLKNKLEKERKAKEIAEKKAKAAQEKEVRVLATASKKTLKKQSNCIAPKVKKAASTVPKQIKAPPKVKAPMKVSARRSVVVPNQGVVGIRVGARKTATCTISLP